MVTSLILAILIVAIVYKFIQYLEWIEIVIKLVHRCLKYRNQGVLNINEELIFVSETIGQGDDRTVVISPSNHSSFLCGIRIDKDHLKYYKMLCGYDPESTAVPICYGETLFLKLLLTIITSSKFCLAPLGLIHLRQTIKQYKTLENYLDTELYLSAFVTTYRETTRGVEVDIDLSISPTDEDRIWQGTVTLLSRGELVKRDRQPLKDDYMYSTTLNVPDDCGIQYACLTGDINPHHLYPWSAKLLGYPRPIAHGMWTLARAMAQIEIPNEMMFSNNTVCLACNFKRPLYMPGRATIKYDTPYHAEKDDTCGFLVLEEETGVPHLTGEVSFS